jgi:hypothetical protein
VKVDTDGLAATGANVAATQAAIAPRTVTPPGADPGSQGSDFWVRLDPNIWVRLDPNISLHSANTAGEQPEAPKPRRVVP